MGYSTYFSLEAEKDERYNLSICKALYDKLHDEIYMNLSFEDLDLTKYEYSDYNHVFFPDELYWEDWYSDMIQISKQFPECTFHLEGFGDDHDDWWQAHFKNGYGYQQMAVIPPFDPAKLRIEDTCLGIDEVI